VYLLTTHIDQSGANANAACRSPRAHAQTQKSPWQIGSAASTTQANGARGKEPCHGRQLQIRRKSSLEAGAARQRTTGAATQKNAAWNFILIRHESSTAKIFIDGHSTKTSNSISWAITSVRDEASLYFRPRRSFDRQWTYLTPAKSPSATKAAAHQDIGSFRLQLKSHKSIEDVSRMFNPVVAGCVNYYCPFYGSAFNAVSRHINRAIVSTAQSSAGRWGYKSLRGRKIRAIEGPARCATMAATLRAIGTRDSWRWPP
jgi:hypothetical protein